MENQELNNGMQIMIEEIKKINEKITKDAEENNELKRCLISDSQEVKTKMDKILKEVEGTNVNVQQNTTRIDRIEMEKRKRNVIIFGIAETQDERKSELEEKIFDILRNKLRSDIKSEEVDYITRMGTKNQNERRDKPRGVLVSLTTLRRKFNILSLKKNLKGTQIFVAEHFSKEITEKRKPLLEEAKRLRSQGKYATVKYDKLVVSTRYTDSGQGPSTLSQNQTRSQNVENEDYTQVSQENCKGSGIKRKPLNSPTTGGTKNTRKFVKKKLSQEKKKEGKTSYHTDSDEFMSDARSQNAEENEENKEIDN